MHEQTITNNVAESLETKWDDARFALKHTDKGMYPEWRKLKVILMNPREGNKVRLELEAWLKEIGYGK